MEEFSFPQVSVEQNSQHQLSFPHFASSPLWFQAFDHHDLRERSLVSAVEDLELLDTKSSTEEVKDEEKMDLLWEDFNEELQHAPFHGVRVGPDWSRKSIKLDGKRHAVPHRRSGLMIILKVLKRLLLIQKIRKMRKFSTYHM